MPYVRFKVRWDANDKLYSEIIRFGHESCQRCHRYKIVECAHIAGRRHFSTRFKLFPKNAIALCKTCHEWFDTHKIVALIWEPRKRVLSYKDESFSFLVEKLGYSWVDLEKLFYTANQSLNYELWRVTIKENLTAALSNLKKGLPIAADAYERNFES